MKYHTEAGSERRWKPYNGGTAGAWSNGGYYAVGLLYHSLFRKNLKWTQVPRSSLLREAIAEGRLSVAMRKLWEAGSRPRVCRAGDVLSRLLSVGKASRQVSNPMAIRNGYGKSCGGDGKKNLMRPLRKFFPIRKPWLTTNELQPLRKLRYMRFSESATY